MGAKYKILFSGDFKFWVNKEVFVKAFSEQLGTSREKAEALYEVNRKVNLKKNLSDIEADRHITAFEKMGMLVTKKLMLQPLVGPCIERESRAEHMGNAGRHEERGNSDGENDSKLDPSLTKQGKKSWSGLTRGLRSLVRKTDT